MYIHNASCAISDTLLWIFRMLNIVYYIKLQCSVNCSAFWFDYRFWRLFQVDQYSKLCTNYHLHCKRLDCFDLLVGWNTQACDKMHVSKYRHRKARNKHSGLNDMSRSRMYRMCVISRVQWEVRYGLQVHTTQTHLLSVSKNHDDVALFKLEQAFFRCCVTL